MDMNKEYTINEQIEILYQYMNTLEYFRISDLVRNLNFYGISENLISNYVTLCIRRNGLIQLSQNIYSSNRRPKLTKILYSSQKHK